MNQEARERLAKLFGRLGSDQAGERQNALAAIDKALAAAGVSWAWVCDLVGQAELLTEGDLARRDRLLSRLVGDRLNECLAQAWSLSAEEKAAVRPLRDTLQVSKSLRSIEPERIEVAIYVADTTRKRAGR
jgi:hypothetical protein